MDTSLIAVVPLAEVVGEFHHYLRHECGQPQLATDLVAAFLLQEFLHIARGAINRGHVNIHNHLARTRAIFTNYSKDLADFADDMADEMYIMLRDELPDHVGKEKHIFTARLEGSNLHINLLVSQEAFSYGVDAQSIIDLVV